VPRRGGGAGALEVDRGGRWAAGASAGHSSAARRAAAEGAARGGGGSHSLGARAPVAAVGERWEEQGLSEAAEPPDAGKGAAAGRRRAPHAGTGDGASMAVHKARSAASQAASSASQCLRSAVRRGGGMPPRSATWTSLLRMRVRQSSAAVVAASWGPARCLRRGAPRKEGHLGEVVGTSRIGGGWEARPAWNA